MSLLKQPRRKHTLAGLLIATLILFAPTYGGSQMTVEAPLGPTASPIEMSLSALPAKVNLREYQALAEKLELGRTGEMITIMALTIQNTANIPVATTLGDIAALTGTQRHLFVAYRKEDTLTGRPTYFPPDWKTALSIGKKQSVTLRLAFIVKKGEHAVFEGTIRVYACFKHARFKGVFHSVSISQRVAPSDTHREAEAFVVSNEYDVERRTPPANFQISDELSAISVRQLRYPTTLMSSGDPSVSLESLLGEKGTDSKLPYWIGVPVAIEEGGFDYHTSMQFLDFVADYRSRFPDKLARLTIWLNKQGILLTPTEHRVYLATSVWGILTVPHEVAEVLLYVASESLLLGIDPSDIAPIPGSYTPVSKENSDEVTGFFIECTGVGIEANRVGNRYEVSVEKKGSGGTSEAKKLIYRRQ